MAEFIRLADVAMAALRLRNGAARGLPCIGKSSMKGTDRIVALGPDEWLVMAPDGDAPALLSRLANYGGIAIDVSGNRVCFRVAGPDARWFLSAGCSIDLDRLQPGDAISTLIARTQGVIVAAPDERFLLLARRSVANYIEAWAARYTS